MESVLSTGCLDSGQDVTDLLVTVEKAIMLIGPQLKHNLTKLDTTQTGKCAQSHTSVLPQIILADFNMFVGTLPFLISWLHNQVEAEIAVHRGKTPPTGPIPLSKENPRVTTDWTTAAGTGVSAGNPPPPPRLSLPLIQSANVQQIKPSHSYSPLTGFALAALLSYTNLNISVDRSFEELQRHDKDREDRVFQVFSRVVSVIVSNPLTSDLSHPVVITLRHLQVRGNINTSHITFAFLLTKRKSIS